MFILVACSMLQSNWNSFELGSILIRTMFEIYKHKNNAANSRNMEEYDDNMSNLSEEESSFGNQVDKIRKKDKSANKTNLKES